MHMVTENGVGQEIEGIDRRELLQLLLEPKASMLKGSTTEAIHATELSAPYSPGLWVILSALIAIESTVMFETYGASLL
jgi:hypothetical protein